MRASSFLVLVAVLTMTACRERSVEADRPTAVDTGVAAAAPVVGAPGDAAEVLETPFTAEQIRDEWIAGFTVTMRRSTAGETRLERWTVVAADAGGADIEFAAVDEGGAILGEPVTARSSWDELRDHASFGAATASRERATRETALGTLEGWVYRVAEEEPGTVNEFFFASSLPGAPVQMTTFEGGESVLDLEQVARFRPDVR